MEIVEKCVSLSWRLKNVLGKPKENRLLFHDFSSLTETLLKNRKVFVIFFALETAKSCHEVGKPFDKSPQALTNPFIKRQKAFRPF